MNQLYVFDQPSDARALMAYLKQQFRVLVLEQISDWPNKHPWKGDNVAPPRVVKPCLDKVATEADEPPLPNFGLVVPIWSREALLKLALPIPVFCGLAALVEYGVLL